MIRVLKEIGRYAVIFVAITLATAGGYLLWDYTTGAELEPVAVYWLFGTLISTVAAFVQVAMRSGWVKRRNMFVNRDRLDELARRRDELEQQRIDILRGAERDAGHAATQTGA